jgi:hypothetical protein
MRALCLALKGFTRCIAAGFSMMVGLLVGILRVQGQDFEYTVTNGTITITNYIGTGGNVDIPSTLDGMSVKAIGGVTFWARTSLTSITIPNSVTDIEDGIGTRGGGMGAFAMCSALTNVNMGNGVVYIGMGTFALCTGLKRVSIPDSVRTVGDFAFHNCASLTDVKIGKNVSQLGPGFGYAFDGSTNLTSVTIPGNVTNVGSFAFSYSPNLTCVSIEEGVTGISDHAFGECPSLSNITLPASVARIGAFTFAIDPNLTGVYFKGNAPTVQEPDYVFFNSTNVVVYHLPGTTGWESSFAGRPTMLWNPESQSQDGSFGVQQDRFGFNVTGTADIPIVIEATSNLAAPAWVTVQSCTLTNGLIYFSDADWTNYATRIYRIRSPGCQ